MNRRNTLRTRLETGETVAAAWLDLGSAEVAEVLVHTGWDVVVVDCEHGPTAVEQAIPLIRAIEAAGGVAVLRVPDGSDTVLKRVLDKGVHSLMVPMVQTAEVARAVAESCLYPPRGRRGYAAPILRASGYGAIPDYARERAHDELLLMVQIEHVDAIEAIPEIAAIEGVSMIFIGPNDLAASMGHLENMAHPEVRAAIARAEDLARAAGLMLGTVLWADHDYRSLRAAGYTFIAGACDVALLARAAREARNAAHEMLA
ncbi:HpcH/HpaI aldolase family protein [Roseinatronobacter alkalisoli]|uniref:Aldolase/citrate lyase family protein n=1 Tax=Roseinatronobacter alkalisoli TaxID=3028235 RepID=A0ABT5TC47_9RHOB|nr:aldolase/citrate lyase family protein [Roseinatronobacter sp. HJB301]MDD7972702.1 aldolase/citrate lyase family protein [Roseinatronobacter sp. HJB301]